MSRRWQPLLVVLATLLVAVGVVAMVSAGGDGPAVGAPASTSRTIPEPRPTLTVDTGCRLGAGPRSLVAVPRSVTERVNSAWERIETWLAAHAPLTSASLRAPASGRTIVAAQRRVGVRFPAALVASLRRHDGVDPNRVDTFAFPPFMHPLTSDRIVDEATVMCGVLEDVGSDGSVGPWWHGRYVPVAVDFGGDSLLLDGDRLGRHYEADDIRFEGGYVELLEQTADALSGGGHYAPVVVDGRLDWA